MYCVPHAGAAVLSVAARAAWPGWPPGLSWPQPLLPLSPLLALSPPEGQNMPVFPAVTSKRALGRAFVGLLIQLIVVRQQQSVVPSHTCIFDVMLTMLQNG